MDSSEVTSQEMLDGLLREGKVTEDEYLRLSKALHSPPPATQVGARPTRAAIPWQVWVAVGIYCLGALMGLPALGKSPLLALIVIVCNLFLAWGLYLRNKWAYGITIFISFISVLGIVKFPIGAIVNVAMGIMLLTVYSWYFPPRAVEGR